jgi:radical SAM/Cys-rich protein
LVDGNITMHDTLPRLDAVMFPAISRADLTTLQVNLGYRCNQSCVHCHVAAGPNRTEMMETATMDLLLDVLARRGITTLDITGGAPEMNPEFRRLVSTARAHGVHVIDRCNLTILFEPGHDDLAQFLAGEGVEIVASLPCYLEDNVDAQRGKGVFDKSIAALQRLNALGYGKGEALRLSLVYNPQGPSLPPSQVALEADYKRMLGERYSIVFDQLFTLANMPIQRFGSTLISKGTFDGYMELLQSAHRDENIVSVMCRNLISVDYDGFLYDCDFNQMLKLPLGGIGEAGQVQRPHLRDLLIDNPAGRPIRVAGHCYGCTAGQGSSCGGALKDEAAVSAIAAE